MKNIIMIKGQIKMLSLKTATGLTGFTKRALSAAVFSSIIVAQANAAATLTEFTLDTGVTGVSTGSFSISNSVLYNVSQLTGSGYTFNYASQLFTPSVDGSYTFGMSSASQDTVLILYQNAYNPITPAVNAIALNDDSDGLGAGGVSMGTCSGSAGLCPKMTETLTSGVNYYVVITTFGSGVSVDLPIGFYVYGEPVGVGGEPPPSGLSVLTSSTAEQNDPVYGAATVIDATPELLSLFTDAGLTENGEISEAASETLPVLTGGSIIAVGTSLFSINNIIDSRVAFNTGMSSGDEFLGDKTIWMKPFGAWTNQDDRGGVTGYDAETVGVIFGADGALNEQTRLGIAFAYASTDVDGGTDAAPQSVDSDVYQLVGYGSHSLSENTEATFRIGYGQNDNKGRRTIAFTNTTASSHYDSETIQLGAGINHSYAYNKDTTLMATAAIDYARVKDDSYSETGAGVLNLNVESNTHESAVLSIGGEIQKQLESNDLLKANLGVGYDLNDSDVVVTASFEGAPTASFDTTGLDQSPWIADAGLAYIHTTETGAEVSLKYDLQYREDFLNQSAAVKVSWNF